MLLLWELLRKVKRIITTTIVTQMTGVSYKEVVYMIECIRTMAKKKESVKPKKEKEEKTK